MQYFNPFKPVFLGVLALCFLITNNLRSQTSPLKLITVGEGATVDPELVRFDSVWFRCMSQYGKSDVSECFLYNTSIKSKSNPITILNFLYGIDMPLSDIFNFKLIKNLKINDSLNLYQMDLGWVQLAMLFHPKENKLVQFSDINYFNLHRHSYGNLTVLSTSSSIDKKTLKKSYALVLNALEDLGVSANYFLNQQIIIYSSEMLSESYRFVGGLESTNYFDARARQGGMSDPHNNVILSGISKPVHTHELIHLAVDLKYNWFIGEGIATYYGGVMDEVYTDKLQTALDMVKRYQVKTFSELIARNAMNEFSVNRVNYVLAAWLLHSIKKQFGYKEYQWFVRNCSTDEAMLMALKKLYQIDNEEKLFEHIYLTDKQ